VRLTESWISADGSALATDTQPDQRDHDRITVTRAIAPNSPECARSPITRDQSWRHAVELGRFAGALGSATVAALSSMTAIIAARDPETAHRRR